MSKPASAPRKALLAGATGLVGRALLPLLLDGDAYARVTVLARGPARGVPGHPKLDWREVDFERLPDRLPAVDDAYIALGTTIKVAGSEGAFRRVDFDYVVGIARAARSAGAKRLAVVSALGADPDSRIFYNRVKGEAERALAALGYETLVIAQPSMLVGDRAAAGQPIRRGEVVAARLRAFVPRSLRPIDVEDVAAAMQAALLDPGTGTRRLSSGQMQGAAHR